MIKIETFKRIPKELQIKLIDIIFGANIKEELERVKNDILTKYENSIFINALLENITCKYGNEILGWYLEVKGLVYIKPLKNPEEHDD